MDERKIGATRIPLKGGNEFEALTRGGRSVHEFRAGVRKRAKKSYMHRLRRGGKAEARALMQG